MKNWRWLALVAVLVVAGALLRGVAIPTGRTDVAPAGQFGKIRWPWAPTAAVTVWFPDDSGHYLLPVARAVPEATAAAAVAEWAAGPVPGRGLVPALPTGMTVTGVQVDGDRAEVALASAGAALNELQTEALTLTLGSVPGVQQLTVTQDGRELLRDRPVGAAAAPAGGDQVRVYYLYRGQPLPVSRPLQPGASPQTAAVEQVLHGTPPEGVDWLPAGVDLDALELKGNTAHVRLRFSPALAARVEAGEWNFAPYYMAVVYTLTDFPEITKVQFAFTGLTAAALKQCRTPLAVPLLRPEPERARGRAGL